MHIGNAVWKIYRSSTQAIYEYILLARKKFQMTIEIEIDDRNLKRW